MTPDSSPNNHNLYAQTASRVRFAEKIRKRLTPFFLFLAALLCPDPASAATFSYSADDELEAATVNIETGKMTMEAFFELCQEQTGYSFVYQKASIPVELGLSLQEGSGQKLSNVLWRVSNQTGVVFMRIDKQIAVRRKNVDDKIVTPPDLVAPDTTLDSDDLNIFMLDPVVVEAEKLRAEQMILELRMQDVRFSNILSSEDFSRLDLGDMGEAATKIAGVSVVGGRFAVIRGLSERYNATLVNGIPVPSPDPEKQGVHLDLFSSDIVDRLEVFKTFSPEAPGNASSGYVNIVTTNIPDEPFASVSIGSRFNERALRDYVTYTNPGGDDKWGVGSKDRIAYSTQSKLGFTGKTISENTDMIGQHESPPWGLSFELSCGTGVYKYKGLSFRAMATASYDSSYKTSDGTYENRWANDLYNRAYSYTGYVDAWLGLMTEHGPQYDYTKSVASVDLSALAAIQVDLDPYGSNKITFNTIVSQSGTDTVIKMEDGTFNVYDVYDLASLGASSYEIPYAEVMDTTGFFYTQFTEEYPDCMDRRYYWDLLYYEERYLCSVQLLGEHDFTRFADNPLKITWAYSNNRTSTKEPDARSVEYYYDYSDELYHASLSNDDGGNNYRSWRNIFDNQHFFRSDVNFDCVLFTNLEWNLSAGGSYEDDQRYVDQTYTLFKNRSSGVTAEELYSIDSTFNTKASNRDVNAEARRQTQAGYFNSILTFWNQLDLITGVRVEDLEYQSTTNYTGDRYTFINYALEFNSDMYEFEAGDDGTFVDGELHQPYWLPSCGLAWRPLEGLVFRLNYSRTIARPSFRESMAYLAFTPGDIEDTLGNPQLVPSKVRSTDFRTEYTWGKKGNMLAVSLFYKEVVDPIEKVVAYEPSVIDEFYTWVNTKDTAYLHGYELEWNTYLDFLDISGLENFSIGGNFSRIDASIGVNKVMLSWVHSMGYLNQANSAQLSAVPDEDLPYLYYPEKRRLYDQPKWIFNINFNYEIEKTNSKLSLIYYAISDVLDTAGSLGYRGVNVHDTYIDSYYRLDCVLRQKLFKNCYLKFSVKNLTDSRRAIVYNPYVTSQKYYKLEYRVGRDFSLSVSYDF